MKPILITLIALVLTVGCSVAPHSGRNSSLTPATAQLDERKAIEIAKHAVAQNDTWADRATYKAKQKDDGTWSVMVWRITGYDDNENPTFTPGGHRLVTVDTTGKVMKYIR